MILTDGHNHLQDPRLGSDPASLVAEARRAGIGRMVVNGALPADWPDVARLADRWPDLVIPAFGLHPWYLNEAGPDWERQLVDRLDRHPAAGVGEIGLDRWMLDNPDRWRALSGSAPEIDPPDRHRQSRAFAAQIRLAAEGNRAASIHCLGAWGDLMDRLRPGPVPARGFLLHSYGGPAELVMPLARLGAYFGFPGYFLHERKARQREVFREVPPDRLLVETDAPDQRLPGPLEIHPMTSPLGGIAVNHPANLPAIYRGLAAFLGESEEGLAARVALNFERLFGTPSGPG
jgi:TatD DNase family protein